MPRAVTQDINILYFIKKKICNILEHTNENGNRGMKYMMYPVNDKKYMSTDYLERVISLLKRLNRTLFAW